MKMSQENLKNLSYNNIKFKKNNIKEEKERK